jgi:hypothetical protein
MKTTTEVRAQIEAQPVLQPGEQGWWKVYGASARDIQPGDYVMTKGDEFFVQDTYEFSTTGIRIGLVIDGERCTFGFACPLILLRQGTKATLSGSIR